MICCEKFGIVILAENSKNHFTFAVVVVIFLRFKMEDVDPERVCILFNEFRPPPKRHFVICIVFAIVAY